MYPPLTKLPQSAHYHRVASSIFAERDSVCRVKQAKWARSRFRLCLFVRFLSERRRLTRASAREHLSSFRSVRPRLIRPDGGGRAAASVWSWCIFSSDQRITALEWQADGVCRLIVGQRRVTLRARVTWRRAALQDSRFRKFVHHETNLQAFSSFWNRQNKFIILT